MLKYLIRDLISVLRFLPWGIMAGIVVAMILNKVNGKRAHTGRKIVPAPAAVCFYMYVVILLMITFFSRESGSGRGIDLEMYLQNFIQRFTSFSISYSFSDDTKTLFPSASFYPFQTSIGKLMLRFRSHSLSCFRCRTFKTTY